jgi:hypothetical protein
MGNVSGGKFEKKGTKKDKKKRLEGKKTGRISNSELWCLLDSFYQIT